MDPITSARLVILPFAVFQWLVVWSLRYLPLPIKNQALKFVTIAMYSVGVFGAWIAQILIYRSMTGIYVVRNDHYFQAVFLTEHVIAIAIGFTSAWELRKKQKPQDEHSKSRYPA